MRLTPPDRRQALYAIYAWMRYADDMIDDANDSASARQRLDLLTQETEVILRYHETGVMPKGPHWPALIDALDRFPIEHQWLRSMLSGMQSDAKNREYNTVSDLLEYCYFVGSTVGLTCTSIWGVRNQNEFQVALRTAEILGRAFQLTNIARDIGDDLRAGRCYVPGELLTMITREELLLIAEDRSPVTNDARVVVQMLTSLANKHYAAAAGLSKLIRPDCVASLYTMTRVYKGVLQKLIDNPDLAFRGRARVGTPAKLFAVAAGVYRQFEASGT